MMGSLEHALLSYQCNHPDLKVHAIHAGYTRLCGSYRGIASTLEMVAAYSMTLHHDRIHTGSKSTPLSSFCTTSYLSPNRTMIPVCCGCQEWALSGCGIRCGCVGRSLIHCKYLLVAVIAYPLEASVRLVGFGAGVSAVGHPTCTIVIVRREEFVNTRIGRVVVGEGNG